jgi:hypothetical protein
MDIQAILEGMQAKWALERARSQMTLGDLIIQLQELPPDASIPVLGEAHSYRGYYEDLAFEEPGGRLVTVKENLECCKGVVGKTFQGYKGGDFTMRTSTPVWIANYGECGEKIVAVVADEEENVGGFAFQMESDDD